MEPDPKDLSGMMADLKPTRSHDRSIAFACCGVPGLVLEDVDADVGCLGMPSS